MSRKKSKKNERDEDHDDHYHADGVIFYRACEPHLKERNDGILDRAESDAELNRLITIWNRKISNCDQCHQVNTRDGMLCLLRSSYIVGGEDSEFWGKVIEVGMKARYRQLWRGMR